MIYTLINLSLKSNLFRLLESKLELLESRLPQSSSFPDIKFRTYKDRKRILITGGAGFVGSHLVDKLMLDGHEVFVVDNYFTGSKRNIEQWLGHENFEMLHHDIVNPLFLGKLIFLTLLILTDILFVQKWMRYTILLVQQALLTTCTTQSRPSRPTPWALSTC